MATPEDIRDGMPMLADFKQDMRQKVARSRDTIFAAARGASGRELDAVRFTDDMTRQVIDEFAEEFDRAHDRFRDEHRQLHAELDEIQHQLQFGHHDDNELASLRIREGAIQARLIDMREGNGNFYPYSYLGSQGFLPNYAFPRKASSVYFTDRKDSMHRAPALALREFAPLNSIYFQGKRYNVVKAQPRGRGGAHHWSQLKTCDCGQFYLNAEISAAGACSTCGQDLMTTHRYEYAFELPDMVARPAGRISCDEDDRMKRGFDIRPYFRFHGTSTVRSLTQGETPIASVRYARLGELLLVNHGLRRSEEHGFTYCEKCRTWISGEEGADQHLDENGRNRCPAGGTVDDVHSKIILYVPGQHDYVLVDIAVPQGVSHDMFGWSLMHALLNGFQVAFSADESEVAGHIFPVPGDGSRVRLLLYETDEGGAGLLNNLQDLDAWYRVAQRALEILHINPETDEEMEDACERACYDCLLSFYNQFVHKHLDRRTVLQALRRILAADSLHIVQGGGGLSWQELESAGIGAEPDVIRELAAKDFPLPEAQHAVIRNSEGVPIAEADLLYPGHIVVWVQGSPHHMEHIRARDEDKRRQLKALGYRIVEIWPERMDDGLNGLAQKLGLKGSEGATQG